MIVSPYLSILLIACGLALIYLFRARPAAKRKHASRAIYADMTIAADVARASAQQVFNVELDLTDNSIAALDKMIGEGWMEAPATSLITMPALDSEDADDEPEIDVDDSFYVLAGYVGTTLAHNHNGVWKSDEEHPLPYVYFRKHDFAVSPFLIVKKKLQAPQYFDLAAHYNNIVWELSEMNAGRKQNNEIASERGSTSEQEQSSQPQTPSDPTDV